MIDHIGKYHVLKELGQGGFGDVYLAEDTLLGSQVALKVLAAHYLRNPTVVERFRQEARAAARLRHPNIVRIYDLGEADGLLYLAMDYLPGRTLAKLIAEDGPLPLARAAHILAQIAAALDHAHGQGLIHRDVKPGNVLVGDDDAATLTDFGLVKAVEGTEFSVLELTGGSGRVTSGGTMIGTPEYMAPELAEPGLGEVDRRTDVYALGVVAYQMLTGRVPFQGSTPVATLRGHVDLAPPPPGQWAALPAEVEAALLRALAKRPEERWEHAAAFAEVLVEAAQQQEAAERAEDEVARLYAQALQAADDRDWARALSLCSQVMERRPGYEEVDAVFLRASEALTRQKQWEAQQQELAALYEEAGQKLQAEDWDGAIAILKRILAISGEFVYRDTPQRLAQATAAKERAEVKRQSEVETLHKICLDLLKDLQNHLGQMALLLPGDPDLARQQELAGAMVARWTAEPLDDEDALLAPERTGFGQAGSAPPAGSGPVFRLPLWGWALGALTVLGLIVLVFAAMSGARNTVWGPTDGSLEHASADGSSAFPASVLLRDFVAEATFYNPYSSEEGDWAYGFYLRSWDSPDLHAIYVCSTGVWRHKVFVDGKWSEVGHGWADNLNLGRDQRNTLEITARDADGYLYINGVLTAGLELEKLVGVRRIEVATAIDGGGRIPGETTVFEDFTIRAMR